MDLLSARKGKIQGDPEAACYLKGWISADGGSGRQNSKGQQPQIAAGEGHSGGQEEWP